MKAFNGDLPAAILTVTIWIYWFSVGAMVVRAQKKTRQLAGLVPEQSLERLMWLVWVPLIVLWMALPWLSLTRTDGVLAVPAFATREAAYAVLRWVAAAGAVACLALTARCWARMGNDWRMAVSVEDQGALITDGLFAHVRHPIYALSMLLMICSVAIIATPTMLIVAIVHIGLMNLKARNEERHLLATHGDTYARYLARTGRFVPRFGTGSS